MIPSKETIAKLNAFIDSLPDEARKKCAICNATLTHIVKQAEAQTGAGTTTVTKALADKINESAAPQDKVCGENLRHKVRYAEGTINRRNTPDGTGRKPRTQKDEAMDYIRAVETVSEEFEAAFKQMFGAIHNARVEGWISTTKEAALKRLESLEEMIKQ